MAQANPAEQSDHPSAVAALLIVALVQTLDSEGVIPREAFVRNLDELIRNIEDQPYAVELVSHADTRLLALIRDTLGASSSPFSG